MIREAACVSTKYSDLRQALEVVDSPTMTIGSVAKVCAGSQAYFAWLGSEMRSLYYNKPQMTIKCAKLYTTVLTSN
jgi:hypothetical protein